MLSYMNGNEPTSDYAKMLDDAVQKIKQNEERAQDIQWMSVLRRPYRRGDTGIYEYLCECGGYERAR